MRIHHTVNNTGKFSIRDVTIFTAWLKNRTTMEIAREVGESREYVEATIKKISSKIDSFEKSVTILEEMGIISRIDPSISYRA